LQAGLIEPASSDRPGAGRFVVRHRVCSFGVEPGPEAERDRVAGHLSVDANKRQAGDVLKDVSEPAEPRR